jgi:nucleotide-binding universal stress UspA family protein
MAEQASILVGIDFSPGSARAVLWARSLAQALQVPIHAGHITDEDQWDWTPDRLGWMGETRLDPETLIVRRGVPWIELSRLSVDVEASILVVGSHGMSGFQPVTPGSVTALLLTRSQRPVLVVPGTRPDAVP